MDAIPAGNGALNASGTGPALGYSLKHICFILFIFVLILNTCTCSVSLTIVMEILFNYIFNFGIKICLKLPICLTLDSSVPGWPGGLDRNTIKMIYSNTPNYFRDASKCHSLLQIGHRYCSNRAAPENLFVGTAHPYKWTPFSGGGAAPKKELCRAVHPPIRPYK